MRSAVPMLILALGVLLTLGIATAFGEGEETKAPQKVTLAVGDVAPDFALDATGKKKIKLSAYAGISNVVLIFYPRDFTSVCTRQLCQFRDGYSQFKDLDAVGFGINDDSLESHEKFIAENSFPFPLLTDPGLKVATSYGAAREDQSFVDRTVVIVGKNGRVLFYAKGVPSTDDMVAAINGETPSE